MSVCIYCHIILILKLQLVVKMYVYIWENCFYFFILEIFVSISFTFENFFSIFFIFEKHEFMFLFLYWRNLFLFEKIDYICLHLRNLFIFVSFWEKCLNIWEICLFIFLYQRNLFIFDTTKIKRGNFIFIYKI